MNIEQLMVQYLYINKRLSLEQVGLFTIDENLVINLESDKDHALPAGAILFQFDKKAKEDEGLIEYITQQTRKIKPLATSDLESYTMLSRQCINIGKPLVVNGLGTLTKTMDEQYQFVQASTTQPKLEAAAVGIREKESEEISFKTERKKQVSMGPWIAAIAVIVVLAIAAVVYYNFFSTSTDAAVINSDAAADTLSNSTATSILDSTAATNNPAAIANTAAASNVAFSIVLNKFTSRILAYGQQQMLLASGHKLEIIAQDSTTFLLVMPISAAIGDTLRIKDSVSKLFNVKASVLN